MGFITAHIQFITAHWAVIPPYFRHCPGSYI